MADVSIKILPTHSPQIDPRCGHLIDKFAAPAQDCWAVYPDFVDGNPLRHPRVIRYVGANSLCLFGSSPAFHPSDVLVSASPVPYPNLRNLWIPMESVDSYKTLRSIPKKRRIAVYYGKARLVELDRWSTALKRLGYEIIIITRYAPNDHIKMLFQLSTCSALLSTDPLSNIIFEAALAGVKPCLLDCVYLSNYQELFPGLVISRFDELVSYLGDIDNGSLITSQLASDILTIRLSQVDNDIKSWINDLNNGIEPLGMDGLYRFYEDEKKFYHEKWRSSPILSIDSPRHFLLYKLLTARYTRFVWSTAILIFLLIHFSFRIKSTWSRVSIARLCLYVLTGRNFSR